MASPGRPYIPCEACDGAGHWRYQGWKNGCPVCRESGLVPADAPVVRISLSLSRGIWTARAWIHGQEMKRSQSRYVWFALRQVGYHDDRPHHAYRRLLGRTYRLDLAAALSMARAVRIS